MIGSRSKIQSLIHVYDIQEYQKLYCYREHLIKERKIRDIGRGGKNERLGKRQSEGGDREGGGRMNSALFWGIMCLRVEK